MNSKALMAAVLAVLITFSLGVVVVSDGSEAAPSDAETIGEATEFATGDIYELGGKSLVFTGEGRLVFNSGSILSVSDSVYLEGSGTILVLMPGSTVLFMGSPYVIASSMEIGLNGSMDFVLDMDVTGLSGSVSMDISDGGEISMMDGITRGGPGKEVDAQLSMGESGMAVAMSMNIPYTSGTLTSTILSSLYPEITLPFESVYAEQTGLALKMRFSMDAATGAVNITDIGGSGPAFMEVDSMLYRIPEMVEMRMDDLRMTFDLETDSASTIVLVGLQVGSADATMTYGGVTFSAELRDLNTDLRISAGADGSVSIDGGSDGAPFEIGVGSVSMSIDQITDVSDIAMTASLTDARLTVSLDIATLQSVPDIDVTLESGSAGVGYTVSTEGVVTTAGASAQGFRVSLEVGADAIGLEASLDSASADLTAIGSPMAIDAEIRDVKVDASITSASQVGTLTVGSVSMNVQAPVGASSYQKRTMDMQGIEAQVSGATVSSMKVASLSSSGPGVAVDSISETVSGLEISMGDVPSISFDSYRADVKGLDGSDGYVEATDVGTTQEGGITGSYVYALGHNTSRALNGSLSFVSSGIVVYDGMTVEFRDSYVGDVQILGGTVNGTAYVCGGGYHTVADQESSYTVDGYGGFDAAFVFEDSRIVSVEATLCSDMYLEDHFTEIEPYDPTSGGVPYELDDDGDAVFTDLSGGTIMVPVGLATFTLTVDGTAGEYQYGTIVTVEASTTQADMVFAGWFDGIQIAMPGGDYYVRYDAEIQELWAPADYDVVSVEGGLSVDIGENGVFFVADVSTLLGARNAAPVTELTVTNSVGSVTVDLEEVGSGSLMVMMSEMGQTPVGYINDAASGSKMYMMQASTLSPDGESSPLESKVSFAESAPVSGITSYGQRIDMAPTTDDQYQVGYDEGVVAYALGEPDGGSGGPMLIIGAVVVVILVVAVVAVVMMRRRSTA